MLHPVFASPPRSYLKALAAVAVASGIRFLLEPWLSGQLPFVLVFATVAISVWKWGFGPALAGAILGLAAAWSWMLPTPLPGVRTEVRLLVHAFTYCAAVGVILGFGVALRRTHAKLLKEVEGRRGMERELGEYEEHLFHTVDLNPQVTWTATPDGQLDHVAERWREWTGTTGLGESWGRGLHPDDLEPSQDAWLRAVTTGEPYDIEHRVRMLDGSYRWARSRAFPRRDPAGRIVKWYGSTEDIDERKRAEQALNRLNATLEQQVAERTAALRANEARVRTIFASTYQYQGLLAPDGTLQDANDTSLAAIGATRGDVIGKLFWDTPWFAATPAAAEALQDAVRMAAGGQSFRRELVIKLPAGERFFDLALRPVQGPGGEVVAIVPEAIDITERRKAEEQLRQAQKIEAIGQLSGGVAHDFNNLLMVISGGLELISRVQDPVRQAKVVASMRQAVQRGAGLSKQLLAFSRRQSLAPRPVDLQHHIRGMQELLDRSLRGDVNVRTEFAADLWPVEVDPGELELVVVNLAVNSRDAMPQGGTIVIRAENLPGLCEDQDDVEGDFVRLSVCDSGTGMSKEILDRVFEPFFTTKPVGQGSGLGLAQAHGFARATGGTIRIDSAVGQGTTVSLLLPRTTKLPVQEASESAVEAAGTSGTAGPSRPSGQVLLVEDDDEVAALTCDMIEQLGYTPTRVASADAALGALANGRAIDLVFSDVMMPGSMNGVDLAIEIRRRRPGLPVLLTSGYSEAVRRTAEERGLPLLPKPYQLDQLARALAAVQGGQARSFDPAAVSAR
ncbi:PAS/PAC sensor hybrid histidine kinase [Burkholderiales bacterium 8X]|nr:PAS/PAC sensor hybrid histidine kinase [Burkholderiales bacterium 8X]